MKGPIKQLVRAWVADNRDREERARPDRGWCREPPICHLIFPEDYSLFSGSSLALLWPLLSGPIILNP